MSGVSCTKFLMVAGVGFKSLPITQSILGSAARQQRMPARSTACHRAGDLLPGPPRRRAEPGRGTDGPVLAGYRRTAGDRGRGQARPFGAADLAAVLATCHRPRRGRGFESDHVARDRGRLDAVIAGLLFMAGMRRSEVSALDWADCRRRGRRRGGCWSPSAGARRTRRARRRTSGS